MSKIIILNEETIKELLDIKNVIKVVEQAYILKNSDQANLFPIITHIFEPGKADMDIKSGHLKGDANIFGLKLVSWFSENNKKGLPELVGTIMVFDGKTGMPLGILSGEHLTCMRTGSAGAIGSKYLARKDSENLLMVGAGHQAFFQIAATLTVLDQIKKVTVYDPINYKFAVDFCNKAKLRLKNEILSKYKDDKIYFEKLAKKFDINFVATDDIEKPTGEADIIITATPSRKPLIKREWIKKGTHFTCIGADMEGKQEIDENIFSMARVLVDDINQAANVGETEMPIKKNIITKESIIGEIGEVILGKVPGRVSKDDITIFDSTGIAYQDLLTATYIIKIAKEKGLGTTAEL
jgi:ornithine cyclodeaminase/alanine dehydrogenase